MMMLHHLLDRRDLAMQLLSLWEYDSDDLTLMDQYRISTNAIYPFRHNGQVRFLRFAPTSEKRNGQTESELAWLVWLKGRGYTAGQPVPSRNGNLLEFRDTVYGPCQASVFSHVGGDRLDQVELSPEIILAYGQALARLHEHSAAYHPVGVTAPWTWRDVLAWSASVPDAMPVLPAGTFGADSDLIHPFGFDTDPAAVHETIAELTLVFENFSTDPAHYGVIHYDFEPDNVFWRQDEACCVPIDFDDTMVHWYAADVAQALKGLRECIEDSMEPAVGKNGCEQLDETELSGKQTDACDCFLSGYRSIRDLPEETLSFLPHFHRFAALYGYARIVRAISTVNPDEPEWMQGLRHHLHTLMVRRKEIFTHARQSG